MSENALLCAGYLIKEKWHVVKKLGSGGFGEIYLAKDRILTKEVAIKVESVTSTKQVLKMEVAVLKRLQGTVHFCDLLGYGRTEKVNYLVMSLLGPNLSELRKRQPQQIFSISSVLRLGIQILDALQALHNRGFLHRDLKPSNIAIGPTSESFRTCFLIDFGLARQYITPTGEVREPRQTAGFRGTVRYASINAHVAKDLGRNDDLWSLFYVLVELHTGDLPWRKIKEKDEVGKLKTEYNHSKLISGLPFEFHHILKYIRSLTYFDRPEYSYLTTLLTTAMQKLGVHPSDPYDWEQDTSAPSVTTASVGSPPAAFKSHGKDSNASKEKSGTKTECSDVNGLSKHAEASANEDNSKNHCLHRASKHSLLVNRTQNSNGVADTHSCHAVQPVYDIIPNPRNDTAPPPTSPPFSSTRPRPPQAAPPNGYVCISARRKRYVRAREINHFT